jgi:hypothetical protein
MNDKTPTALDRLLDQVPVGQAPIGDLLTAGHAAKRRQRRALIGGVVAATVLVLGGGFIAAQALSSGDGSGNTNQSNLTADRSVTEGTHLVGIGQVTVAVPDTWKANNAFCNNPLGDTYFFPYPQDCVAADPYMDDEDGSTSVAITTGEFTETGTRIDGLKPQGEIGGHEIVGSGVGCFESNPPICTEVFGVPDLNAYFTVRSDAPGGAQIMIDIRKSLTLLEPEVTTVPFVPGDTQSEVVAALEDAGLSVRVETWGCPDTASCFAGVTDVSPAVGSVVPTGSTVTVTVALP